LAEQKEPGICPAGERHKQESLQDILYKEIINDYKAKLEKLQGQSSINNLKEITETNIALAETYLSMNDLPLSLYHFNQAALCEETLDKWEDRIKIFEKLGEIYTMQSKWENALNCFRTAKEIAEQNKDESEQWARKMATIYHGLGKVYWRSCNYDKAEHFVKKGIKLVKGKDLSLSDNYVELANLMNERGQSDEALKHYKTALKILEEIGDIYHQSRIFNNISDLYLQTGEYKKSLEYVDKCIENSKMTQNKRLLGFGYLNGAEDLAWLNKPKEGFEYIKKAEEIFCEMPEPYNLGNLAFIYGILYKVDDQPDKAREYMQHALSHYTEADIPYYIAKSKYEMAALEFEQGNKKLAQQLATEALDIWSNIKAEAMVKTAEKFLRKIKG